MFVLSYRCRCSHVLHFLFLVPFSAPSSEFSRQTAECGKTTILVTWNQSGLCGTGNGGRVIGKVPGPVERGLHAVAGFTTATQY